MKQYETSRGKITDTDHLISILQQKFDEYQMKNENHETLIIKKEVTDRKLTTRVLNIPELSKMYSFKFTSSGKVKGSVVEGEPKKRLETSISRTEIDQDVKFPPVQPQISNILTNNLLSQIKSQLDVRNKPLPAIIEEFETLFEEEKERKKEERKNKKKRRLEEDTVIELQPLTKTQKINREFETDTVEWWTKFYGEFTKKNLEEECRTKRISTTGKKLKNDLVQVLVKHATKQVGNDLSLLFEKLSIEGTFICFWTTLISNFRFNSINLQNKS